MSDAWAGFLGLLLVIGLIFACILGVGWLTGYDRTKGGEVAIVRNGGWFDNKQIRGYIPEASDRQWTGLWSSVHKYPAQQRFYKISSNAEESDTGYVDQVQVPTSDGINVGIEGTLYFELATDETTLKDFDNRFGTRKFSGHYPWEGDDGFAAWLNTVLRPIIDNNLRKIIGSTPGPDLNPSLALVQNNGQQVDADQGKKANEKIADIELEISEGLAADVKQQLRGDYLTDIRFVFSKAVPPASIQARINETQGAFADVSKAQAGLKQAQIEAKTNREKQRGFESCPACAQVEVNKSIPSGITTWAPGRSFSVTP